MNHYTPEEPDAVEIAGVKTWNHGNNPNPPDSIIVYVYADGELTMQRQVTAKEGWKYAFELPKYAEDGHEIVYTVGEADVPGYTAEIKGYDLVNTYTGPTPEPPDPGDDEPSTPSTPPGGTDSPKTGDNSNLTIWVVMMFLSLAGLIMTPLLRKRKSREYKSKRH